jgi:hypothetical protein
LSKIPPKDQARRKRIWHHFGFETNSLSWLVRSIALQRSSPLGLFAFFCETELWQNSRMVGDDDVVMRRADYFLSLRGGLSAR